jgi:hypothetical protein
MLRIIQLVFDGVKIVMLQEHGPSHQEKMLYFMDATVSVPIL